MIAQTNRLSLADLPDEAVDKLKNLDLEGFQMLGIEAGHLRYKAEKAELPTDANAAIEEALDILKAEQRLRVVEPLQEIIYAFDILCIGLGTGDDLDKLDCQAFWSVADRGREMANAYMASENRVRQRLHALKEAV